MTSLWNREGHGPSRPGAPTPRDDGGIPGDLHIARRHVTIGDPLDLHMRPAAKLAALARSFRSIIRTIAKETPAGAKSLLDLVSLAAECGMRLAIAAHGPDADEPLTALTALIGAGLDISVGRGVRVACRGRRPIVHDDIEPHKAHVASPTTGLVRP